MNQPITILGRKVSLAVLLSFAIALATQAGGVWLAAANSWGTHDPAVWIPALWGAVQTTVTVAIHVWDTNPVNVDATTGTK